jgi:DNA-binding XRE family transcriptional regulator
VCQIYEGLSQDKGYSCWLRTCQWSVIVRVMTTDDALLLARVRQMLQDGGARSVRERAGLSQTEVGQVVGVSGAAVSRWEQGTRLPRSETGLRYARLLDSLAKLGTGAVS